MSIPVENCELLVELTIVRARLLFINRLTRVHAQLRDSKESRHIEVESALTDRITEAFVLLVRELGSVVMFLEYVEDDLRPVFQTEDFQSVVGLLVSVPDLLPRFDRYLSLDTQDRLHKAIDILSSKHARYQEVKDEEQPG